MTESCIAARREMEDLWRRRLEDAHARYRLASAHYRRLLGEKQQGSIPGEAGALEQARHAAAETLSAYSRLLKIFTDMTLRGKVPEEQSAMDVGGGGGMMGSTFISVVDDEEAIRDSTKALLRSAGYQVAIFKSGEEFLESGLISETGCLILDVRMPGMNGLELQRRLKVLQSQVPVIFVTAHDSSANLRQALEEGACDVLQKPVSASDFLRAIETALKSRPDTGRVLAAPA